MKLPTAPQDKLAVELYEAISRQRRKSRNYLGMSQIGEACELKLWFGFRGFPSVPVDGRVLMIFRFGDLIESDIIQYLHEAGYLVEGRQDGFAAHDGFFRGHCDGIIHGITRQPHILEIKSANDKKFKAFKDFGVLKTYPAYYAQVQCYMGYGEFERALVIVQNKNDSHIYTERIDFNRDDFNTLHQKAYKIISSDYKFMKKSEVYCNYCEFNMLCKGYDVIMENRVCGNCTYFDFKGLEPWCLHECHNTKIKTWGIGCPNWDNRYEKIMKGNV
jgi:YqaJ viral recombinase family.